MTKKQARAAMKDHTKIQAGPPGTEDYDTGVIHEINGDIAIVGWDSGVVGPCPVVDLSRKD